MTEAASFTIGAEASCTDGACGHVTQVVMNPLDDTVTHLVVEPEHRQGLGRLVPVDWVDSGVDHIALRCTKAEFEQLETAEEVRFLPGTEGDPGYTPDQMWYWPYFGGNTTPPVTVNALPVGEVALRRGQAVNAADGPVGKVEGLIVDTPSRKVTHVLLQKGHLFGQRDVAIPIAAVTAIDDDGVSLSIPKAEVDGLPTVEFHRRF